MNDINLTAAEAIAILNSLSKRAAACTSNHELSKLAREAGTAEMFLYDTYGEDTWRDVMKVVDDRNPWVAQFDRKGNWTGTVANENGCTP